MDNLTELTAFIGGIAGLISLTILIYKTLTERPVLKFAITDAYFWTSTDQYNPMTSFNISLNIHNKGQRSTAIHTITLSFDYNGKTYFPKSQGLGSATTPVTPDNTIHLLLTFYLPLEDGQFSNDIKNCELTIGHTHGEITISIPKIRWQKA